ncbi:LOG family protein [Candidatus Sumerlaeota bacterium]|nr:LOG family protein [Candidatus Sumerlaeota bacterium]
MKVITLFGSAKCKAGSPDYELAREIGSGVGTLGLQLCNGGYGGVMEASAQGAREAGAHTIGVTLASLAQKNQDANPFIAQEIPARSLKDRVEKLIELGDAYICLRGGTGTLVELSVAAELILKQFIEPRPLLIYAPYWRPLIDMLRDEIDAPDLRFPDAPSSQTDILFTPFENAKEAIEILRRNLE